MLGDLTVSETPAERTDGWPVCEGAGLGERLVVTCAPPELIRMVAGHVKLDPPARALSTTRLADTEASSSTVVDSTSSVVIGLVTASRLNVVAVLLRADLSPLVLAGLSFLDEAVSTFPKTI